MMVYDEEIDLRKYIKALFSRWMWIVGATLVLGVVAAAYSLLQAPVYEAEALITVSPQPYQIRFEPSFESSYREAADVLPPNTAYPELALSDDVMQQLLSSLGDELSADVSTVEELRRQLEAKSGSDRLLNLQARFDSPETAAAVVNQWALLIVDMIDDLYGSENETQVAYFEAQAEQALADLDRSEGALIEFQAEDPSTILKNQLNILQQTQIDYLNRQKRTRDLLRDIAAFKGQLLEQRADADGSLADDLTHLLLQVRAYNSESSSALQLQIDQEVLNGSPTRGEQIEALDDLMATLQTQLVEWDQLLRDLEPEIMARQQQLAELSAKHDRLLQARNVNRELYTTLTRKLEEVLVAAEEPAGDARLASRASIPTKPVAPKKTQTTVIGAFAGFALSVVAVLLLEAWQSDEEDVASTGADERSRDPTRPQPALERTA